MAGIQARFHLDWPGFVLDVDLDLPARGVTALFGHSGSGKTTLLRCIAGLERARQGRLVVNDEVWQDTHHWLPTHQRPLGYVFQEASLFAHLSVLGNLRYGLRRAHGAQRVRLDQAIALLGIDHLLARKPDRLSGGERQRVAIARALVNNPRLVLADEPTGNLDARNADSIFQLLGELNAAQGTAFLVVTHDLQLAKRMGRQLEMRDGRLNAELTLMGAE